MTHISQLPIDIICVIFGLLGFVSQGRLAQTCKFYRMLLLEKKDVIWPKFQTKKHLQMFMFPNSIGKYNLVKSLYLPEVEDLLQIHLGADFTTNITMLFITKQTFSKELYNPRKAVIIYKDKQVEILQRSQFNVDFDGDKNGDESQLINLRYLHKLECLNYQATIYNDGPITHCAIYDNDETADKITDVLKFVIDKFFTKNEQIPEILRLGLRALGLPEIS